MLAELLACEAEYVLDGVEPDAADEMHLLRQVFVHRFLQSCGGATIAPGWRH